MTPDWCLIQYMARLEGLMDEQHTGGAVWTCTAACRAQQGQLGQLEGTEPQEQALHKRMELTGRMTELVLSPGALAAAITRFKANTYVFLITSIMQAKDMTAACLHLNIVEPCLH